MEIGTGAGVNGTATRRSSEKHKRKRGRGEKAEKPEGGVCVPDVILWFKNVSCNLSCSS